MNEHEDQNPCERLLETFVSAEYDRCRLDRFLALRFNYKTRSQWQRIIREGGIVLNGTVVLSPSKAVHETDHVILTGRDREEPQVDSAYTVLFEDEYLLALDKSGDLPVHPAGPYFNNTLSRILAHDTGKELFLVHRLDRETSGVILFAKNAELAGRLSLHWKETKKDYLLLVHGCFESAFECTVPIGPAYTADDKRDDVVKKKRKAYEGAPESAHTSFYPLEPGQNLSLVGARLYSGRQHQIRVHCKYLGFPVVGDKIYGLDEKYYLEFIRTGMTPELERKTGMKRCALHSHRLSFIHPVTQSSVEIVAPLKDDIRTYLDKSVIPVRV